MWFFFFYKQCITIHKWLTVLVLYCGFGKCVENRLERLYDEALGNWVPCESSRHLSQDFMSYKFIIKTLPALPRPSPPSMSPLLSKVFLYWPQHYFLCLMSLTFHFSYPPSPPTPTYWFLYILALVSYFKPATFINFYCKLGVKEWAVDTHKYKYWQF